MRKILVLLMAVAMCAICLAACSADKPSDKEYPELNGLSLDKMVTFNVPDDYFKTSTARRGMESEIISEDWQNDNDGSLLSFSMLTYNGKGVLGTDGDINEYIEDSNCKEIKLDSDITAYLTHIDGTTQDDQNVDNMSVEAHFEYKGCVLELCLDNVDSERSITEEQEAEFVQILKSAKFS